MTEDLVDAGHLLMNAFLRGLQELDSPESYRGFVLRFFDRTAKKELMLSIIATAEMTDSDLLRSDEFKQYFSWLSHREFARKTAGFTDERIRLGLGL